MARNTPTSAMRLRVLARRLLDLADRFEVPSETTAEADLLIEHVEQAASEVRAVVRGRG